MPEKDNGTLGETEGNALKALSKTDDEIRVGNYIVLFGGRDLEGIVTPIKNRDGSAGNYFTEETDLESSYTKTGRLYVDWEHGYGKEADGLGPDEHDILGYVDWKTIAKDKMGVWVERVLNRRNEYMRFLEMLIEEGLIGNSSETTGKGIEITDDGRIIKWPLMRDTLTVMPTEPRMMTDNAISAIKALAEVQPSLKAYLPQESGDDSGDAKDGGEPKPTKTKPKHREAKKMPDEKEYVTMEEVKELLEEQGKETPDAGDPALETINKALSDGLEEIASLIASSAPLKDGGYVAPDSEEDHAEVKTFGDFLVAVRQGNHKRLKTVYKAAMAESSGPTGGYLVPVEMGNAILAQVSDLSVLRRAGATVVPMAAKSKEIPVLDIETAPSAGDTAFAGGAIAYWEQEAASTTETEPAFRLVELIAHKLMIYSLASSEVREDAVESVDGILATVFARAVASKENYAFFRGDGVGKPLGILNSSALISATRSAASTVALGDLAQMVSDFMPDSWGRGAWFINPAVIDQLLQLVSAPLSWLESLRSGIPPTLLGMPLYPTGALPALNTAGDILLADPSYYLIGDRSEVRIAFSEHYRFANDQLAWRVTKRVDGQPWVNSSITLEDAATTVSPFVVLAAG
jgi:HK97 family phage major capsid protein